MEHEHTDLYCNYPVKTQRGTVKYCDMSNRCWTTGCGTRYHENRLLINSRLPSYATVSKALFLRAVSSQRSHAAVNNSRQRCQATPL
jgi:hypothetical protein